MSYKITVSGNFETKKGWSGLQKHMEHDSNVDHSNKFLNSDISKQLRKYNQHIVLDDFNKFCNKEFKGYVDSHDKHHAKKEQYGSVDQFIKYTDKGKLRPQPIDKEYLIKLGDKNTYNRYISNLCMAVQKNKHVNKEEAFDMAMKTTVNGFSDYVKGFNQRNPNLKMFEGYIHADEEGAMHVHTRVLPLVNNHQKTKSGQLKKPSFSLNTALSTQYGMKRNGKKALAKFREIEDNQLLKSLDNATIRELNLRANFELDRKKDHDPSIKTGLDHDEYVRQRHLADISELEEQEKVIQDNQVNINKQNEQLNNNKQLLITQNNQINLNTNMLDEQKKAKKANQDKLDEQAKTIAKNQAKINVLKTTEQKFIESYNKQTKKIKNFLSKITGAVTKRIKAMGFAEYDNLQENQKIINDVKDVPNTLRDVADNIEETLTMVEDYNQEMNDYVRKASEAQKTASKPISKETGKNTHDIEKDDDLDF